MSTDSQSATEQLWRADFEEAKDQTEIEGEDLRELIELLRNY